MNPWNAWRGVFDFKSMGIRNGDLNEETVVKVWAKVLEIVQEKNHKFASLDELINQAKSKIEGEYENSPEVRLGIFIASSELKSPSKTFDHLKQQLRDFLSINLN